jgi:hypothetical protein
MRARSAPARARGDKRPAPSGSRPRAAAATTLARDLILCRVISVLARCGSSRGYAASRYSRRSAGSFVLEGRQNRGRGRPYLPGSLDLKCEVCARTGTGRAMCDSGSGLELWRRRARGTNTSATVRGGASTDHLGLRWDRGKGHASEQRTGEAARRSRNCAATDPTEGNNRGWSVVSGRPAR